VVRLTAGKAAKEKDAELAYFLGLMEKLMWANSTRTDVMEKVIVSVLCKGLFGKCTM